MNQRQAKKNRKKFLDFPIVGKIDMQTKNLTIFTGLSEIEKREVQSKLIAHFLIHKEEVDGVAIVDRGKASKRRFRSVFIHKEA